MKSISLFVDNGTYLTRVHPFTKLMYIAAAISIPLISGRLWMFAQRHDRTSVLLL